MRSLLAIPRWIFWKTAYLFRRGARTVPEAITEFQRTKPPWRTFKPHVEYNAPGSQWEIYLSDEPDYHAIVTMEVDVGFHQNTFQPTCFILWQEELDRLAQEQAKQSARLEKASEPPTPSQQT